MPALVLLALGIGAMFWLAGASGGASWPPTASIQSDLVSQLAQQAQAASGSPMTTAQLNELQASIDRMPALYPTTLPPGTPPTIAGYQTWVLQTGAQAIAYGGSSGYASASGGLV
jgi:hypothetical protein